MICRESWKGLGFSKNRRSIAGLIECPVTLYISFLFHTLVYIPGILCIQANSKASSLGGQQVLDCHLQFPQGMPVNYVIEWKKDGLKDPVLLQFYGYPPNVNELYTDRVRLVNGISLEISHIQEYDEGWYECKVKFIDGVENDKKKSNGTWIYLNVNIPPKMLDYSPQSFHQPLGSNVTIFCRAEGSPKPSVSWTKDGRPVRLSSRVSLNKDSSEVLIRNLQESDGGIYKCTFQNTVGLIAQTIHLIVEGQAYIIGPPSNRTAVLGQRIEFTCEARGYPTNITYRWYKDHQNVNTLPGFGAIPGSKPRISISERDGSLIITIVEKEDMGWYTCRPSNGVGQDPEAGAYLNITYKPEVLVDQMPRSAIWALGFKEKLLCPVDANPPAYSILWTKNGMVIKTTSRLTVMGNGTLVVSQVAMSDSGNYRCTAISSIGNGESEIVQVEVKDPPRFIIRPEATYIKTLGQSVTMACAAAGTPLPQITWRNKETGMLQSNGRVQRVGGNLTIHNLQKSDHGVYECEASNEVRKIVVSTLLTVQNTTPHAPYNVTVHTDVFYATLTWIASYSSTPQNFVIWYRSLINGNPSKWQTMRVEPQNATRFTIYRLEPDTLYEFKVASRNMLGSGESSTSAVVQARTKDKDHSTQKSSGYVDGKADYPPVDESGSTYFPPIVKPHGPKPATPANVTLVLKDDKIIVSWNRPAQSPVPIFRYMVEYNVGNGWVKTEIFKADKTSYTFDSVEKGQPHSFRVYSFGVLAVSDPSEIVSLQVPEEGGFGLSKTEIGGIVGGLLFLVVAITLAVVAVMCSRRRDRRKQVTKYGNVKYLGPQDDTDGRPEYPPEWSDVTQGGRRGDPMTSYHSNTLQGQDNGIFVVPRSGDLYSDMSRDYSKYRDRESLLYHPDNSRSVPYAGNYGDGYYRNADITYQSDRNKSFNRSTKSIPYDNDDNGFKDNVRLRNRSRSQPASRHSDGPRYPVPDRPRSRGISLPRDISKESERYPPQPQVPVLSSPHYSTHGPLLSPVIPYEGHDRSLPGYPGDDDEEEVFMPPPISSIIPNRPSFPRHSSMKPSAQQTYLTEDFDSPSRPFLTSDLSSVLPSPFTDSQSRPYHPYQRQYADVSDQGVPYGSQSRLPEYSHNGSYGDMDNTVVARQPSPDRTMSRTLSNGENSSDSSGRPMNYTRDQLLGAVDQVRKGPKAARRGQQWGSGPDSFSDSPSVSGHGAQFPESAKPSVIVRDRPSRGHSYEHDPFRAAGVPNSRGSVNSSGGYSSRGRNGGEQSRREDLTPDSLSSGIGSRNTSSQLTGSSLHSRPSRLGSNLTPMDHDISEDSAVPFLDYPPAQRKDISGDENYEFDSYNAVEKDLLEALKNYSEVNNGNDDLFSALQEGLSGKGLMSDLYPKPSRQSRYSDSEQRFEKLRGEFQKYRQKQQQEESSRSDISQRSRSDMSQRSNQDLYRSNSHYPRNSTSSTHSSRNSGNYGYPDRGSQYYGGRGDNFYKPGPMDSDML
ncbi:uncharacterized protein LOC132745946 isoform X3 [Ruditapes philippinarum]|uniref:uncharacterized protein LOC132745946 isoform X3 n=1 Tax=Ruditapes philippinarum TaxID=129788 RepID=UPI00295A7ACB|nr:uncharacterized protein LOC132745946 isoform X3 [Ruditapes philippinarum]